MIQGIKIINYQNDEEESLYIDMFDPSETGIYIKSIEGLGTPPASIETSKIVNYDPSEYENTAVNPRNIVFTLGITNDYIVEKVRQRIYRYFVQGMPIKMVFMTDVIGSVYIIGVTETVTPDIFSDMETVQASVICSDPYFYTGGKISFDSSDKIGLFNFTTWWEANVKNGEIDGIEKPVSRIVNEASNTPVGLTFKSRVKNPKGLEIEISQKDNMFYKVILEYEDGQLTINPKDLEGAPSVDKNFFQNASIVILNDVVEQNVYKKDLTSGDAVSILDKIEIKGDFPDIKRGTNYFVSRMYGVYEGIVENELESYLYDEFAESIYKMANAYTYPTFDPLEPTQLFQPYEDTGNGNFEPAIASPFRVWVQAFEAASYYGEEYVGSGKKLSYSSPRAYKVVYKLYNSDNRYIGSISFRHDTCIMNKYAYYDTTSSGEPGYGLYDSYNYDVPSEYKEISKGKRYHIVKDEQNRIESLNVDDLNQNVYHTMYPSNITLLINRSNGSKQHIDGINDVIGAQDFEIPDNNIFEVSGTDYRYVYMFDAIYNGTQPLIFEISDLQISEKDFLETLYSTTTNQDNISAILGLGRAYVNVRKEDNLDSWNTTVPIYQETYDGKITLSYDDRYDAI